MFDNCPAHPSIDNLGTTANDIVSVDDSLTCTEPLMTDDTILRDVLDEEGSETEDDTDDVSNEPLYP